MADARSGSATLLVFGALLLLGAAVLLIAVLPIATCDWCDGSGRPSAYYAKGGDEPPPCPICEGKGRVTPLRKWSSP